MLRGKIGAQQQAECVVGRPFEREAARQLLRALARLGIAIATGRIGDNNS